VKRRYDGQLPGGSKGPATNPDTAAPADWTSAARAGVGSVTFTKTDGEVGAIGERKP
jgi:hypothetical protein